MIKPPVTGMLEEDIELTMKLASGVSQHASNTDASLSVRDGQVTHDDWIKLEVKNLGGDTTEFVQVKLDGPDQARQLAALLLKRADEVEGWREPDHYIAVETKDDGAP